MIERLAGIDDPRERLVAGFLASLDLVRESPALHRGSPPTHGPIGGEIAEQSEVIKALAAAFVVSLGPDDPDASSARPAGWCG